MSKQINTIQSSAVPLQMENVDTDQIIPARFLKATSREGFGKISSATGVMSRTTKPNPSRISS